MTPELRKTVSRATLPWKSPNSVLGKSEAYAGPKDSQAWGTAAGDPSDTPEMIQACLNCTKPECTNCFG